MVGARAPLLPCIRDLVLGVRCGGPGTPLKKEPGWAARYEPPLAGIASVDRDGSHHAAFVMTRFVAAIQNLT